MREISLFEGGFCWAEDPAASITRISGGEIETDYQVCAMEDTVLHFSASRPVTVTAGEESRAKARLSSMWGDSPPLAAVLPCVPFSGAGWHPYTTALFGRFVEALCRPFPKWAVIVLH